MSEVTFLTKDLPAWHGQHLIITRLLFSALLPVEAPGLSNSLAISLNCRRAFGPVIWLIQ